MQCASLGTPIIPSCERIVPCDDAEIAIAPRHAVRIVSILVLLLIMSLVSATSRAEDVPNPASNDPNPPCGPHMDGQVSCRFGILYECELISPNSLERRSGWHWKADLLRTCGETDRAKTDDPQDLPPEDSCGPGQPYHPYPQGGHPYPQGGHPYPQGGHPYSQAGRRSAGAATAAGRNPQEGVMHISPNGCSSSPNR
jgi:hypothetical protein